MESLNKALFLIINASTDSSKWAVNSAIFIGDYLIYLFPLTLLTLWLWGDQDRKNMALKALFVAMLAVGLNQLIAIGYQHPRPFMIGLGQLWIEHAADSSFPSDHVTVFASIGITFLFANATRLGGITLLVGFFVAWSRIYLGVHYPLDMIGAVVVALIAYMLVTYLIWQNVIGFKIIQLAINTYTTVLAKPIAKGWIHK